MVTTIGSLKPTHALIILSSLLLLLSLVNPLFMNSVRAQPQTWTVDDDGPADFATIQEAINNASDGDTIFVYNGTYFEHVNVNKSITIIGQNPLTTIIDGSGVELIHILNIYNTTNVTIANFTVQNTASGFGVGAGGISTYKTSNVTIQNCVATQCYYGILISDSTNCRILQNKLMNNYAYAIDLRPEASQSLVISNFLVNNPTGVYLEAPSVRNNSFYRNNFVNNTNQLSLFGGPNFWDNGAEGNYWDNYAGLDDGSGGRASGDGVGDTNLPHLGVDYYPLIEQWNDTRTYPPYDVIVNCNHTVASFAFNNTLKQISFYITGPSGENGHCNVTIPKALLSPLPPQKWIVMLGQNPITYTNGSIANSTRISFNYTLGSSMSENKVRIKVGIHYPPTANFEFAPDPASTIEPVNFTDTSTNSPNGTIVWRQWNFSDGTITETNETFVAHQFGSKGVFNVTLTVKDENNLTDSLTKPVRVNNLEPFANFTFSPAEPFAGLEVSFNASMSNDVDGIINEFRWDFGDGNVTTTDKAIITHKFEHVGTYNVNLTVRDNDGAADSITWSATVEKGETRVEIEAPTTVKVEEVFTITATLRDNASQLLAGEQIGFFVYNDETDLRRNSTTDNDGVATATFSLSVVGDYSVNAEYEGSADYLESNDTKLIVVNLLNTSLILQAPENITQNEKLTMSATLLDENENPVYNATIEFYFYNGSSWESLGSSKTNQNGVASFDYIPQNMGTFMLKAVFSGTETYAASNSSENNLTTVAPEINYVPYIILVIIITAIACLVLIALKRRTSSSN